MTNDLERRFAQHQSGYRKGSYTHLRRPLVLKWHLQCTNPSEAIKIEKQIKGWSHKKKKALIEENWTNLVEFAKNYTEYGHPYDRNN